MLNIAASDGSGTYVFIAYGDVADQIERLLFNYRRNLRAVAITIEYDPQDGQTVLNFSVVTS